MAYGGGYLVAVDSMGKAAYSEDGVRWTATDPGFGGMGIKDVAYGAGRFVVVGGGGRAAYCDVDIVDINGDLP
jgi:hypothetical protein